MTYDKAQIIKDAVDIRAVCELYGVVFQSGRNQAHCPFHDDRNPSASVKNGRFHCFVCDLHLDCFDFVQQIAGCDFKTAMQTLNAAFGLGMDMQKPVTTNQMRRIRRERAEKEAALERERAEYMARHKEFVLLRSFVRRCRPALDNPDMGRYAEAIGRLQRLEEYFADHPWR